MTRVYRLARAIAHASCRVRHVVVDWTRRVWHGHQALMADNPAYRRQAHVGIGALLGVLALHPDLRLIASALFGLYIAAHEDARGGHLSPRPDPWSSDDW